MLSVLPKFVRSLTEFITTSSVFSPGVSVATFLNKRVSRRQTFRIYIGRNIRSNSKKQKAFHGEKTLALNCFVSAFIAYIVSNSHARIVTSVANEASTISDGVRRCGSRQRSTPFFLWESPSAHSITWGVTTPSSTTPACTYDILLFVTSYMDLLEVFSRDCENSSSLTAR